MQDLKQIKTDLGKFSNDLNKYIDVFQELTPSFDLSWNDVMLLLDQTLSGLEKQTVLEAAQSLEMTFI